MSEDAAYEVQTCDAYLQNEAWFEVSRTDSYILIVNSYGRLRKVYFDGSYTNIHDGGEK